MVVDESSLLMAMVEILLASDGPQPVVIYTDVEMEDTIRLLPDEWRVEAVGEDSFGSRVSEALLNGPVVAFPPWGRQEGSPIPRETAALEGVHGGATSHYLLLVVPAAVLVSHAGKSLRTEISTRWQLMAVVSCMGAIVNVHRAFTAAVIMLSPIRLDRPVIRMFEASNRHTARQAILDDFKNLLRREGGTTEFGYVLREPPEIGAPLNYRLYDPRIVSRRAQLSDYIERLPGQFI